MTALLTYKNTGRQEFHGNIVEITFNPDGNVTRLTLWFENGGFMIIRPEDEIHVKITN